MSTPCNSTTPAASVRDGKPNWPVVLRLWAEWGLWGGEPPDKSDYLAIAEEIDRLHAENSALKRDLILCDKRRSIWSSAYRM